MCSFLFTSCILCACDDLEVPYLFTFLQAFRLALSLELPIFFSSLMQLYDSKTLCRWVIRLVVCRNTSRLKICFIQYNFVTFYFYHLTLPQPMELKSTMLHFLQLFSLHVWIENYIPCRMSNVAIISSELYFDTNTNSGFIILRISISPFC